MNDRTKPARARLQFVAFPWMLLIFMVRMQSGSARGKYQHCVNVCGGGFDRTYGWCQNQEKVQAEQAKLRGHAPGHIEVLTILPLHRKWHPGGETSIGRCDDFDGLRALTRLEAVRVAVKIINDEKLLGGWKLGAEVIDSCNSIDLARKELVERMLEADSYTACYSTGTCDEFIPDDELPWNWRERFKREVTNKSQVDDEDDSAATLPSGSGYNSRSGNSSEPAITTAAVLDQQQTTGHHYSSEAGANNRATSSQSCSKKAVRPERRSAGVRRLVIGPTSNRLAEVILPFTRVHQFVELSYAVDSRELHNRDQFPHFFPTAPSLQFQAQAIVALMEEFSWHHVAIFASDDAYGNTLLDNILVFLEQRKLADGGKPVCATLSGTFSADDEEGISAFLETTEKARLQIILLLASKHHALAFLETAYRMNVSGYTWVGTWKWTMSQDLLRNKTLQSVLQGGVLSVAPAPPEDSFVWNNWKWIKGILLERLRKLVPSPPLISHIPWLRIFWQEHFGCILTKETSMAFRHNANKSLHSNSYACLIYADMPTKLEVASATEKLGPVCSLDDNLSGESFLLDETALIIHTFFVVANGLKGLFNASCSKWVKPTDSNPPNLESIGNDSLRSICKVFSQNNLQNADVHVNMRQTFSCLLNDQALQESFEQLMVTGNDPKQAAFVITTLNYSSDNHMTELNQDIALWTPSGFQWLANRTSATQNFQQPSNASICAHYECPPGTEKNFSKMINTRSCCWSCEKCSGRKVRSANISQCEDCRKGYRPNKDHITCQKIIPTFYTAWNTVWVSVVVSASVMAGIGVLVSIKLIYKYRYELADVNTHSYVFLLCQASALFLSVLTCVPPSDGVCTAQLLLLWPWPCALYANWIFSKTNPVGIIQSLASTPSQYFTKFVDKFSSWAVAGWAVIFLLLWAIAAPPTQETLYKDDETGELECEISLKVTTTYYALTLFVFVAMTMVAFLSRRAPSTLNERKYVFIAALLTTLLWLFFLPATYVLDKLGPTILLCLICTFQGIVVHVCLVSRPIYYIIFEHPAPKVIRSDIQLASAKTCSMMSIPTHVQTQLEEREATGRWASVCSDNSKTEWKQARVMMYIDDSSGPGDNVVLEETGDVMNSENPDKQDPMADAIECDPALSLCDSGLVLPHDGTDQLEVVVYNGTYSEANHLGQ